jgi:hypothetical protein
MVYIFRREMAGRKTARNCPEQEPARLMPGEAGFLFMHPA